MNHYLFKCQYLVENPDKTTETVTKEVLSNSESPSVFDFLDAFKAGGEDRRAVLTSCTPLGSVPVQVKP